MVDAAPVLLVLLVVIVTLAIVIGRTEGWTLADSVYYGFVTVGYGDFRPRRLSSKALAIVIAFVGLIQIGIVVALAVQAITETYDHQAAEARGKPAVPQPRVGDG